MQEIEAWHAERIARLKAEDGWLNLAGLFWLKEGVNSLGADSSNDIAFVHPDMPARAGIFERSGNRVIWKSAPGVRVLLGDTLVTTIVQFSAEEGIHHQLSLGQLRWSIIQREEKIGIRLRDLQHPALPAFHGIERFPYNPSFRLRAQVIQQGKIIRFSNVLGQTITRPSPGTVMFAYNGREYTLDALYVEAEGLLLVFCDATSALETYGAGRFLHVPKPDAKGETIIDFNKAHNPPCAFTPYATCPLPPKQNMLPFAVNAGEKKYK